MSAERKENTTGKAPIRGTLRGLLEEKATS